MGVSLISRSKRIAAVMIDVRDIAPNPMQPRRRFSEDGLNELAESIKRFGVIQPVAVRRVEPLPHPHAKKPKYELIAGERRWRAAKLAGKQTIPCVVIEADADDSAAMALVENLQRCDLSFFEEAAAMKNLLVLTGMTQTELAHMLSITQPALCNKLRLLRINDNERRLIEENSLSERHARALVRIESERDRRAALLKIIDEGLSAQQAEKLALEVSKRGTKALLPGTAESTCGTARLAKHAKKQSIKGTIKDIRILYNTIERAVALLNAAGMSAEWEKREDDSAISVTINVKTK